MSTVDLQFENIFKITTMSLHINRAHPAITRNKIWLVQFISIMMLSIVSAAFLTNSLLFHDIPDGKYAEASKNGSMAIVAYTITFKYFILLYYQRSIKALIEMVDADYELSKQFSREERDVVIKYSQKGVTVCKFWLVSAVVSSAIFPIKAFVLMFYHYWHGDFEPIPMFDMTYPHPIEPYKDYLPMFFALFLLCLLFDSYATTMYIGFDPLVPLFMLHTCGQLDLLSLRVTKLFSDVDNPRNIEKKLKNIVLKIQQLYRFVERVKSNFTVLYEYNMKTTTFLLPLAAFQIVEDLRRARLNVEFISFFTASILQFYLPCYYGDLLMEKSEGLRQALYSCGWEKQPDKRVRQMVLLMMTRAVVPLSITTIFYPICLDTFAEMCRQSYAIFNLMNAAWAK